MESWSDLPFTNKNWEEQGEKALNILQSWREIYIDLCLR